VKCGLTLDRDLNASKNILKKALTEKALEATAGRAGSNAFGDSVRPFAMERLLSLKEELNLKNFGKKKVFYWKPARFSGWEDVTKTF